MKWYRPLYLGDNAKEKKYRLITGVRLRRRQHNVYVIVLAENGKNLLEIYPSFVLLQDYYRRRELEVVGIACGYQEACQVVRQIIDDVYQQTGSFDVKAVFRKEST